jgi:hypothetical protein
MGTHLIAGAGRTHVSVFSQPTAEVKSLLLVVIAFFCYRHAFCPSDANSKSFKRVAMAPAPGVTSEMEGPFESQH